jgi:hypothetical protein
MLVMTPSKRLAAALLAACTLAGAPAAAQEGYYDGAGNWVEVVPPPPGVYRYPRYVEPPVVYEAPPEYYEPPPDYYEPPPAYAEEPQGWGRRVLVPPEDIPGGRPLRPLRRDELPPEFRDDPRGYAIAPDPDQIAPPEDYYGEAPAEERLRQRNLQAERVPELDRPSDLVNPPPELLPEEGPVVRRAPPPSDDADVRSGDWNGAVDALFAYAPAKKAAVALQDPFARLAAMKAANAWLVSKSVQPATAGTISAVDKLLGIPVTPESTALPGAGTSVERPKGKGGDAFADAVSGIADYAAARADAYPVMSHDERTGLEQDAANRLLEGGEVVLDRDERAGLDLFLGFGEPEPRVAAKSGGAAATAQ